MRFREVRENPEKRNLEINESVFEKDEQKQEETKLQKLIKYGFDQEKKNINESVSEKDNQKQEETKLQKLIKYYFDQEKKNEEGQTKEENNKQETTEQKFQNSNVKENENIEEQAKAVNKDVQNKYQESIEKLKKLKIKEPSPEDLERRLAEIKIKYNRAEKEHWESVNEIMLREKSLDRERDIEQFRQIRREMKVLRREREIYILERDLELVKLEWTKKPDIDLLSRIETLTKEIEEKYDGLNAYKNEVVIKSEDKQSKKEPQQKSQQEVKPQPRQVHQQEHKEGPKEKSKIEPEQEHTQERKNNPREAFRDSLKVNTNNTIHNTHSNSVNKEKEEFIEINNGYLRFSTKQNGNNVKSEIRLGSTKDLGCGLNLWEINGEKKILSAMQLYSREKKDGKIIKEFEQGEYGSERSYETTYDGNNYTKVEKETLPVFDESHENDGYGSIVGSDETITTTHYRESEDIGKLTRTNRIITSKYDDSIVETKINWTKHEYKGKTQKQVSCMKKVNDKPIFSISQKDGITTLSRYTPDGEKFCSFRYDKEGKPMDKVQITKKNPDGKIEVIEQTLCFPGGVGNIGKYKNIESIDFSKSDWLNNIMCSDFVESFDPKEEREGCPIFVRNDALEECKEYLDKMEKENQVVKKEENVKEDRSR